MASNHQQSSAKRGSLALPRRRSGPGHDPLPPAVTSDGSRSCLIDPSGTGLEFQESGAGLTAGFSDDVLPGNWFRDSVRIHIMLVLDEGRVDAQGKVH
jgi:hypothetical protein